MCPLLAHPKLLNIYLDLKAQIDAPTTMIVETSILYCHQEWSFRQKKINKETSELMAL
jgi:hypothetical protein